MHYPPPKPERLQQLQFPLMHRPSGCQRFGSGCAVCSPLVRCVSLILRSLGATPLLQGGQHSTGSPKLSRQRSNQFLRPTLLGFCGRAGPPL